MEKKKLIMVDIYLNTV